MGKMVYALASIILIEALLYFFGGGYSHTSLFSIILNPYSLTLSNDWYLLVRAAIWAISIGFIIPGTFIQINIYSLYAGVSAVALTFVFTLVNFALYINNVLSPFSPTLSKIIMICLIAPLFIFYFTSVLEWIRQN